MEKIFADRCPRCGEIFEYTEEATLLKCEFCQHTFRVAEFMSQRQKLAQQLEAGEVAKQALVETQAEKTKLQERLNNTLTALELIQSSQDHEESALNNILEVLEEDRQTHDAMVGLLHAMRSEQATGQDALSQLLCTMMQEQSSVEGKLNEVQALVTRILDAQMSGAAAERKMRREIQDEIDHLKINEELKGKLAEEGENKYTIDEKLSSGGEGIIYTVKKRPNLVAKVFSESRLDTVSSRAEMESKITAMIAMNFNPLVGGKYIAAWPQDLITDDLGNFLGYVMPKMSEMKSLRWALRLLDRNVLFENKYHWRRSVEVAFNLSVALDNLHCAGVIVGDMNPSNILVSKNSEVCFIGTDGYSITTPSKVYSCECGLIYLLSPELHGKNLRKQPNQFTMESDRFALAILIFSLLCNSCHPFAIEGDMLETNILSGRCPYVTGSNLPTSASVPDMNIFPPQICKLFDRAFGYSAGTAMHPATINDRPTAHEWYTELAALLDTPMVTCSMDRSHEYPAYCKNGCPWCKKRKLTDSSAVEFFKKTI